MTDKKILKVPVYMNSGEEPSFNSKRLYSDLIFYIDCPNCSKTIRYQPNTYTFLYVPDTYKHVHFYCEHCEHEDYSFFLDDIKNGHAHVYKNPDFKGKIKIKETIEKDIEL